MTKFELTAETITFFGKTLFRIKALISFGNVKAGELGGYVEKEENLDHGGNAWVYGDARVYGNARVYGDARVYGNARVCGDAWVCVDADYATAKGFGSVFRTTTFYRTKENQIGVRCGCFSGTLEQFREKVISTYPDDKKGKEYLMLADLMEYHFKGRIEEEK